MTEYLVYEEGGDDQETVDDGQPGVFKMQTRGSNVTAYFFFTKRTGDQRFVWFHFIRTMGASTNVQGPIQVPGKFLETAEELVALLEKVTLRDVRLDALRQIRDSRYMECQPLYMALLARYENPSSEFDNEVIIVLDGN